MSQRESSSESGHQEKMADDSSNLPLNARGDSSSISRSRPAQEILVERNARDVLCGRGVQVLHHAGNLHLHLAADELREEYLGSRRDRKREIIETIVKRLRSNGSRFLKTSQADKTKWVEADDTFAYQKVSHVLRGQNTGKAVKKIKKQESEVAKQRKEQQQALQTASTRNPMISQVGNFAMMPNPHLRQDASPIVSQAPLDSSASSAIDTTALMLQNHPLLSSQGIASLREANLGTQMLQQQQQSFQWPGQSLLQNRGLLSTSATGTGASAQPNLANLLRMQPNTNPMFLPQRSYVHLHQEQARLMDLQQSLNPSAAVLQQLMQPSSSAAVAASQEQQQRQLKLQLEQQSLSGKSDNVTSQTQAGGSHVAIKQGGLDLESRHQG